MRTAEGSADEFRVECGVRQGCVLSPLLFNWYMDRILRETWVSSPGGWNIDYTISKGFFLTNREKTPTITDVRKIQYVNDLTLAAESGKIYCSGWAHCRVCTRWGMTINVTN